MRKNFLLILATITLFINLLTWAQQVSDFTIIPSAGSNASDTNNTEECVDEYCINWNSNSTSSQSPTDVVNNIVTSDDVIEEYNNQAEKLEKSWDIWTAFATGVFSWNLILLYIKYLIKFLSQIGLVIGALMIIYAWYLYASAVFAGSNPQKWATAVKNAIIWILIIVFSYAILKILTAMFL